MFEKLLAVLRHCGNENVPCEGCPVHNECGYFDIGAARNMREAADAIEKLIEIIQNHDFLESLIKSCWIPATELEQLPKNESVLIYSKAGGVAEGKYNPDTEEWTQYRWSAKMKKDVTHWMLRPKPPEDATIKDGGQDNV